MTPDSCAATPPPSRSATDDLRHGAALVTREASWAIQRLTRRPFAAAVAVFTVAVALAPSLMFQLVARAVLPPLPFERAQDLVMIRQPHMGNRVGTCA